MLSYVTHLVRFQANSSAARFVVRVQKNKHMIVIYSAYLRINGRSSGNHGSTRACQHVCAELCAAEDGYSNRIVVVLQ